MPKVIESDRAYRLALETIQRLMFMKNRTPEQEECLRSWVAIVEDYEKGDRKALEEWFQEGCQ